MDKNKNGGGQTMTIELIELLAYPATAFLAVTLTAKLVERQRDVLYGPISGAARPHMTDSAKSLRPTWWRSA